MEVNTKKKKKKKRRRRRRMWMKRLVGEMERKWLFVR